MHIAVVDDFGTISGVQGAILEKHISLSKAEDAISAVNSPQKIYYKQAEILDQIELFYRKKFKDFGFKRIYITD